MSDETQRARLQRVIDHYDLHRDTLSAVAQLAVPARTGDEPLSDSQVELVNDALEILVLSGFDSDQAITEEITRRRQSGAEWQDALWRELLASANAAWLARGRPEFPPPGGKAPLAPVAPIGPQPPQEIDDDDAHGGPLAA